MTDILKRLIPPQTDPNSSMWVDEAIWGHRLHDEQTPWLVYMEFLNVFYHELSEGNLFIESEGYNTLKYRPAKRLYLRNILFNNPKMEEICRVHTADDVRWRAWTAHMKSIARVKGDHDFGYLQEHFETFEDFYRIVSLVRSTSLETSSNKRWTSKFVFPYGEASLYADLGKDAMSSDRRFFGRTGEMLYLMLCRTKHRSELAEKLKQNTKKNNTVWNTIINCLNHPDDGNDRDRVELANAFVPYESHPCFDTLAKDWITLLSLDMPGYDALPHLVNLIGFHIILYQLTVAAQVVSGSNPRPIVCEIVAPKKTLIREVSCTTYQENNLLPVQAVDTFISNVMETEAWKAAASAYDPFIKCQNLLIERFLWPRKRNEDYDGPNDPEQLVNGLRSAALKRHNQHVGNVHRIYGRAIGLVSRRGTNRLRYAPTDDLLKTFLFTNVQRRMELHLFLERLWKRYGIVIGDAEGEKSLRSIEFDKKSFRANSQRLEQRLVSLGLLRRLSDGCAYVMNPYYSEIQ